MTHITRNQWGSRPRPFSRVRLDPADVEGVALHWPGTTTRYQTIEGVKTALRAWQRLHMDTDQIASGGASDIAYQVAVDQGGNSYVLRGLRTRSGANGDQDVNERFGAILLILATDEKPSDEMVKTVRRQIGRHRQIFPHSTRIVGHGEIRPGGTQCPGAAVQSLIEAGAFTPKESK